MAEEHAGQPLRSVCIRCGADKEFPLGRCSECGHLPSVGERALSLLASTRVLSPVDLASVQTRIRRGEPLAPSAARLQAAGALLVGEAGPPVGPLSRAQEISLLILGILLTPIPVLAVAWAWRDTPVARPALRVALIAGVVNVALAFSGWVF